MSKSHRIRAILADDDFLSMVALMRDRLTKKVMAQATSDEDRQLALAEYHALDSLMAIMRSEASNAKDK